MLLIILMFTLYYYRLLFTVLRVLLFYVLLDNDWSFSGNLNNCEKFRINSVKNSLTFFPSFETIKPFQTSNALYIKTSPLICSANQMTGLYMKCNTRPKWINPRYFKK